jgi:hypothetical protein
VLDVEESVLEVGLRVAGFGVLGGGLLGDPRGGRCGQGVVPLEAVTARRFGGRSGGVEESDPLGEGASGILLEFGGPAMRAKHIGMDGVEGPRVGHRLTRIW